MWEPWKAAHSSKTIPSFSFSSSSFFHGFSDVTALPTFFGFIRISAVVLGLTTVLPLGVSGSRHRILSSHVKYSENDQQGERTTAKQSGLHAEPHATVWNNVTRCAFCHCGETVLTFYMKWRYAKRYFSYLFSCELYHLERYSNTGNINSITRYKITQPTITEYSTPYTWRYNKS